LLTSFAANDLPDLRSVTIRTFAKRPFPMVIPSCGNAPEPALSEANQQQPAASLVKKPISSNQQQRCRSTHPQQRGQSQQPSSRSSRSSRAPGRTYRTRPPRAAPESRSRRAKLAALYQFRQSRMTAPLCRVSAKSSSKARRPRIDRPGGRAVPLRSPARLRCWIEERGMGRVTPPALVPGGYVRQWGCVSVRRFFFNRIYLGRSDQRSVGPRRTRP
jgi:hypothetical protein